MVTTLPRVVIAAPASGHGKTTVATGLMAALGHAGHRVSAHKIGPDYIDPGYHALATGRPGRNLDPHLVGTDLLVPLLLHGAATPVQADISIIEGVMGLYDGAIGREGFASTAHVAGILRAPVILVVDISASSRTVAAVVHGLATFDEGVRIAGVILNKAGSERHATEVRQALEATGMPVLGVLHRDDGISAPSRHLGLVPAAERADARHALDRLAGQIAARVDLAEVARIAATAADLTESPWDPAAALADLLPPSLRPDAEPVVAIAGGRAFTFRYPETDELLRAAGCRPVVFDPMDAEALPAGTAGVYLGGGFPEVHAAGLSGNVAMREALSRFIRAGTPTAAECAGLLYLARTVDGAPMVGTLDAEATMTPRLTLSYRTAIAPAESLLAPAGYRATGHEFHRTTVTPMVDADPGRTGWLLDGVPAGFSLDPSESGTNTLHASYLHTHWAGQPSVAARFADAVQSYAARQPAALLEQEPSLSCEAAQNAARPNHHEDLHHHGDADLAEGLIDLAVNVRLPAPPEWLAGVIRASVDDLAAYPDPRRARAAIADAHGVAVERVLPSAGGAELFTLLARARRWSAPVVVHPQFTEPEAALRAAGHHPRRVILSRDLGFRLDPRQVPADADLVIIGNPTNPTGVLHPAELLHRLARPGRLLVVDEAFMDAVPGETESLITGGSMDGVLVLRSLTKTWGLAGLRAGYAVGDPVMITALAGQQAPWSVSTPAAEAMIACVSETARDIAAIAAEEITGRRDHLLAGLVDLGLVVVPGSRAPFVLVDSHGWLPGQPAPGTLRARLRERGFAVRRGETFPGLGPGWIRLAVRDEETTDILIKTLRAIRGEA